MNRGKNGNAGHPGTRPASIQVSRRFRVPRERVFRAWLEPEVAARWLFATALQPMTEVEIDPRVGGSFRFADHRNGTRIQHAGRYLEIVPHRRLVFTLALGERPRVRTRVIAEITPLRTGCELALTHEDVPPDRAGEAEARWVGLLYGLDETLSLKQRARPRRFAAGLSISGPADRPARAISQTKEQQS